MAPQLCSPTPAGGLRVDPGFKNWCEKQQQITELMQKETEN